MARWIFFSSPFGTCTRFPVLGSRPVAYMQVEVVMGVGVKSWTCSVYRPVSRRYSAREIISESVQPGWPDIRYGIRYCRDCFPSDSSQKYSEPVKTFLVWFVHQPGHCRYDMLRCNLHLSGYMSGNLPETVCVKGMRSYRSPEPMYTCFTLGSFSASSSMSR